MLDFSALKSINIVYGMGILLMTLYWFYRLATQSSIQKKPKMAWYFPLGLVLMLLAPMQEVPHLTGIGIVMILMAEYLPEAYVAGSKNTRSNIALPITVSLASLVLLPITEINSQLILVSCAGALVGMGALVHALFWKPKAPDLRLGFYARWQKTREPSSLDFSINVTSKGATLKNISKTPLEIAGWSTADRNDWFAARDSFGKSVSRLASGEEIHLPLEKEENGVYVWYVKHTEPSDVLLLKARWQNFSASELRNWN